MKFVSCDFVDLCKGVLGNTGYSGQFVQPIYQAYRQDETLQLKEMIMAQKDKIF